MSSGKGKCTSSLPDWIASFLCFSVHSAQGRGGVVTVESLSTSSSREKADDSLISCYCFKKVPFWSRFQHFVTKLFSSMNRVDCVPTLLPWLSHWWTMVPPLYYWDESPCYKSVLNTLLNSASWYLVEALCPCVCLVWCYSGLMKQASRSFPLYVLAFEKAHGESVRKLHRTLPSSHHRFSSGNFSITDGPTDLLEVCVHSCFFANQFGQVCILGTLGFC